MLKQSSSRNLRSKGFKVKDISKVCLLLAIGIWLVNQLKHSYDKKAHEVSTGKISEEIQSGHEVVKLGRKDLHPLVGETGLDIESKGDKVELNEEIEEVKTGEIEDEGRGGLEDEIDGHDQEKTEDDEPEEVEDLIDVDDREREERSEDQEINEKSNQLEDVTSVVDKAQNEGERNLQEVRKDHYKSDDVSSSFLQNSEAIITQLGIGGLRKMKEEKGKDAQERRHKSHNIKEEDPVDTIGSGQNGNQTKDKGRNGDLNLVNMFVDSDPSSFTDNPIDTDFGVAAASLIMKQDLAVLSGVNSDLTAMNRKNGSVSGRFGM